MKKKIIGVPLLVLSVIFVIAVYINNNDRNEFIENGVTYALTVNGSSATSFPSKGMYRVDVECANANGKWDYDNWKLYIESITGQVSCNISFTSTSKTYLNNYIKNTLTGETQGAGQVVHETFERGDFSSVTKLTKTQYGTTSQYYNSSYSTESGTAITYAFTFSNNEWSTMPTNLTSGRTYHLNFTVPSNGAYQLCYEMSSGNANNRLYIYQGSTNILINGLNSLQASTSETKSGCVELGYVMANTSYRVVQYAYSEIATIKFTVQKANTTNTIDTGYRYEGKNPNNYIWFNNELWRIIGVFGSDSHGIANTNLVKIIRGNPLGGLTWDKANTNNWSTSSLKKLWNPIDGDSASGSYYNATNGIGNAYCYGYSTTVGTNCDYSEKGIKVAYRPMVKNVTWYLGGYSTNVINTDEIYRYERNSNSKYSSNPASDTGYVGLMYVSDYGYSVIASTSCPRTTGLNSYDIECAEQSWLYGKGFEWTITPKSNESRGAFSLNWTGIININSGTNYGYSTRPVLYLDSSVYVLDGDGSITDPYIIGM